MSAYILYVKTHLNQCEHVCVYVLCVQQCMSRYIQMWCVCAIFICYYETTLGDFYIYGYIDEVLFMKFFYYFRRFFMETLCVCCQMESK